MIATDAPGAVDVRVFGTVIDIAADMNDDRESWSVSWAIDVGAATPAIVMATGTPAKIGRMLPVQVGERVICWGGPNAGGWLDIHTWQRATKGAKARATRLERWATNLACLWARIEDAVDAARARRRGERVGWREEVI